MALRDTLETSFTSAGFDPSQAFGGLADTFSALDLPTLAVDPDIVASQLATLGSLDPQGIAGQVEQLVAASRNGLGPLPSPERLTSPLTSAIAGLQQLAGGGTDLTSAVVKSFGPIDSVAGESTGIEVVAQRLEGFAVLATAPIPAPVEALAPRLLAPTRRQGVHDLLGSSAALHALVAGLRSLAELRAVIDGMQRFGQAAAALPDLPAITKLGEPVLAWDAAATAARVTSGDAASKILPDVSPPLAAMREYVIAIGQLVVLGSATVSYFDVSAARATWDRAATAFDTLDPAPIRSLMEAIRRPLEAVVSIQPGTPAATTEAFAEDLRTLLAGLNARLAAVDVTVLTKPITDATDAALSPVTAVTAAINEVRTATTSAGEAVAAAIHTLDLDAIAALIRTVLEPLTAALKEIDTALAAVTDKLGAAAQTATASIEQVRKEIEAVSRQMLAAFTALAGALDQLDVAGRVEQARAALAPAATALGDVQIREAASAAADGIDRVASVVGALPLSLLPDSALTKVRTAVKPLKEFDFDTEITQQFAAQVDEIRSAVDTDVLQEVRDATVDAAAFLESIDPSAQLTEFEQTSFDPVLGQIQALDADALVQPVRDVLARIPDLTGLLAPADAFFDELIAKLDAFAPHALLDPIARQLADARDAAIAPLHLGAISTQLAEARESALESIDEVGLQRLLGALDDLLAHGIPKAGTARGSAVGQLVVDLTGGPTGASVASAVDGALVWVRDPAAFLGLGKEFSAVSDQLLALRATVRDLDPSVLAAPVEERYEAVAAAIATLPADSSLRRRLETLLGPSPAVVLAPLTAARADLVANLTAAIAQVSALAVLDLRPLGNVVGQLRSAFAPLADLRAWATAWVERAGIALEGDDLQAGLVALLELVREELRSPASAAFEAQVRTALRSSVAAVLDAVSGAVARVTSLVASLDLAPIVDELDQAFRTLRADLMALRPSTALADVASVLETLERDVRGFDPLKEIRPVLDSLKQNITAASTDLRPTVLFAPVLTSYASTTSAIGSIDVDKLLEPILTGLQRVTDDVESGLGDVGTSFGKLQTALP